MRSLFASVCCSLLALAVLLLDRPIQAAEPEPYDLVLRNGTIVDGTGNPWYYGDVAIRGDRIVAVGRVPAGPARREIDLKGLVVAPGFIDMQMATPRARFARGSPPRYSAKDNRPPPAAQR
jgi:N-acyl-D-amino-acid deacylase